MSIAVSRIPGFVVDRWRLAHRTRFQPHVIGRNVFSMFVFPASLSRTRRSAVCPNPDPGGKNADVRFSWWWPGSGRSAHVKSFGRRQAYESPRGRNPRATVEGYGDFALRLIDAVARAQPESGAIDAGRSLRCASARLWRHGTRLVATLSAAMITTDACGSVAGGVRPAAEDLPIPCQVMKPSPGLSPSHPEVRAAASSVQTPR